MKHSGAVTPSLVWELTLANEPARTPRLLPPAPHISRVLPSKILDEPHIVMTLINPRIK